MKRNKHLLILVFLSSITLLACRKKDERYEGTYVGLERYTVLDSGEMTYTVDTTYVQEVKMEYVKKLRGSRSYYTVLKTFNDPGDIYQIFKNDFEEHTYTGEGGYLEFSGDSIHLYVTNFSDYMSNTDHQVWDFRGIRK